MHALLQLRYEFQDGKGERDGTWVVFECDGCHGWQGALHVKLSEMLSFEFGWDYNWILGSF